MRLAIVLLLACGGKPAPQPPHVAPADALAAKLDGDLAMLADLAHRYPDCVVLSGHLRAHVDVMQRHATEVKVMMGDPVTAEQLKAALARYSETGRTDQIAKDLGAAYLGCKDAGAKYQLEHAISDIPTYE